jgi:hypothetical protein
MSQCQCQPAARLLIAVERRRPNFFLSGDGRHGEKKGGGRRLSMQHNMGLCCINVDGEGAGRLLLIETDQGAVYAPKILTNI